MIIGSDLAETEVDLQPDASAVNQLDVQSFADAQEWRLNKSVRAWREEGTSSSGTKDGRDSKTNKGARICVACQVSRQSGFFIWNVFVIMVIIHKALMIDLLTF